MSNPLRGVPEVVFAGQGGLSDVVLAPDFLTSQTIFFSYSARDPEQNNAVTLFVARAVLDSIEFELKDVETVFIAQAPRRAPVHFGAKLLFLPDGTLLIASGDGFDYREEAQNLDNHFGKMVRINKDGSVPDDNPFVDRNGVLPEIWSYGHRNQQGLIRMPDGAIYSHEHGPRGGDELNIIKKGANYGWPLICYCLDYSYAVITPFTEGEGLEQPETYWRPSIAPAGIAYYNANSFPDWADSLFVTGLVPGDVRRLVADETGSYNTEAEVLFAEMGARIRNIYPTPEGFLMLLVEGKEEERVAPNQPNGRLVTVKPNWTD